VPKSQTDRAKPQEQRTIQEREFASIDLAQLRGRMAVNARWMKLMIASDRSLLFRTDRLLMAGATQDSSDGAQDNRQRQSKPDQQT
jgi:hypothetical protein